MVEIEEFAFLSCNRLKKLYLPKSIEKVSELEFPDRITLCAPAGSYAEQYAKENNIPFVAE